ncbi:MAG: gluconokinase [Actinomycetota bacterium]|nr:gluconokinase [Actinomycetota bacterium]
MGTTGVKAVAFAPGSSWHRVAVREYPLLQPAPGRLVQDPATIVGATASALSECIAAAAPAEPLAVSVSAAMHGLIALDAQCVPLTPLITWADSRAAEEAWELHRSGRGAELHARTGTPTHPMTPLAKLLWFAGHDRAIWTAARWWVGLKDYLLWWLTGTLATELSSASATGLLDMSTRTWSSVALGLCGVPSEHLPPILPTTSVLPMAAETARQVGLPAGTSVVVGAADGPLGNVGTGAMAAGVASLSLGTSGAVRIVVPEPQVDLDGALFCYALTGSLWVVGGATSNGGGVVRWAGRSLAPDVVAASVEGGHDAAVLRLAAGVPPGSEGLVMLPYLVAERAPLWEPDLPGAYLGLRRRHTRAHLVRAAVEGVCMQMRLIVDRLDAMHAVRSVRATGGVFRSPLWREVMAAAIGRPLHLVGDAEGTARGAAALGIFALGRAPTLAAAAAQLGADDVSPPIEADGRAVAVYARVRERVPALVASLDHAARAFLPPAGSP